MGYFFKKDETVSDGIRRLTTDRIDSAIAALGAEGEAAAQGVHDARKRCKQVRALLRLTKDQLGSAYAEENMRFRDYGRQLSGARDAQVLLETLDKLGGGTSALRGIEEVREILARRRDELAAGSVTAQARAALAEQLRADRARIADWPLRSDHFDAIRPGLERVYRRGRCAMKRAYRDGTDAAFHEWRKQVKYHWYHVRLLAPAWPAPLEARAAELKRLSDCLGDDHDLALLRATLGAQPEEFGGRARLRAPLRAAAKRQRLLRADARDLGRRLYAERAGEFGARMAAYWTAWRR